MKDKYNGCYIDNYKDHYAIFSKDGKVLGEYDSHKEAKEDLPEYESMTEDHSEISNDPEMEQLMALAGITTEDLNELEDDDDLDLDDDDPIDVNTMREIDAAMDESATDNVKQDLKEFKDVIKNESITNLDELLMESVELFEEI